MLDFIAATNPEELPAENDVMSVAELMTGLGLIAMVVGVVAVIILIRWVLTRDTPAPTSAPGYVPHVPRHRKEEPGA